MFEQHEAQVNSINQTTTPWNYQSNINVILVYRLLQYCTYMHGKKLIGGLNIATAHQLLWRKAINSDYYEIIIYIHFIVTVK